MRLAPQDLPQAKALLHILEHGSECIADFDFRNGNLT